MANIKGHSHGPKRDYAGVVITQQETAKIAATWSLDAVLLQAQSYSNWSECRSKSNSKTHA